MIFIELVGGKQRRLQLEFHPCMTVVDGFGPRQRWDMANRLTRSMRGEDIGFEVSVDIDGQPELLDSSAAARLGIASDLDNVIGIEDIPGVQFFTEAGRFVPPNPADPNGRISTALSAVDKAERSVREATARLDGASRPAGQIEQAVLDRLSEAHNEVLVRVGEIRESLEAEPHYRNSPEKRLQRRERLEAIERAIDKRIRELRDQLAGEGNRFWSARAGDPDYTAHVLKNWREVVARLAEARPPVRAPQWLVDQTRRELQLARRQVQQLMVSLGNGDDVFEDLEEARDLLRIAERQWSEIERANRDEVAELQAKRAEIFEKVIGLAAREIEIDEVEDVLEELASQPRTAPERPVEEDDSAPLRRDLAAAVLDIKDVRREMTELDSEEMIPTDPEDEQRVQVLKEQLREAEERERELGERYAELQVAASQPRPANPQAYEAARLKLAQARDALSNAERELEYEQSQVPAVNPTKRRSYLFNEELTDLEIDMSQVDMQDVKFYVMSRASALRRAANGKPVPLVIDSAFDELPDYAMFDCLAALMQAASVMQIIYLAGHRTPVEWAKNQDEMRVAVTRMGVV